MKLFATILLLIVIIIYFVKIKFSFDRIEGSGDIVSEDRELIDFQSISLLGSIDVTINYLDAASCTVVGDDNIIEHVKTEVINDKLTISIDKSYSSTKALVVNLSVLNVNELSVSGSGDIKFKNYKDDTLSLKISGSGDILGDGNVETLTGKINGSGDLLLKELHSKFGDRIIPLQSDKIDLQKHIQNCDLLIGGILVPGANAPKLVSKEMIRSMKRGAVVVDVAIDQGGCVETSKPTTHADPTYMVGEVVHYCVTNMPGVVPMTSTLALNAATLPFVLKLAQEGYKKALASDANFLAGLNICQGNITYKAVADDLNYEYIAASSVIN